MKTVFFWLLMVAVLSVYPFKTEAAPQVYADKVVHFIIYAITCALFKSTLPGDIKKKAGVGPWPLAILLASVYGLLMEVAQHFVPGREFSFLDEAFNIMGALSAPLFFKIRRRKGRR